MNGNGEWWVTIIKIVGIPGAVAAYFMLRDWIFASETLKVLTSIQGQNSQMIDLLRQLVAK